MPVAPAEMVWKRGVLCTRIFGIERAEPPFPPWVGAGSLGGLASRLRTPKHVQTRRAARIGDSCAALVSKAVDDAEDGKGRAAPHPSSLLFAVCDPDAPPRGRIHLALASFERMVWPRLGFSSVEGARPISNRAPARHAPHTRIAATSLLFCARRPVIDRSIEAHTSCPVNPPRVPFPKHTQGRHVERRSSHRGRGAAGAAAAAGRVDRLSPAQLRAAPVRVCGHVNVCVWGAGVSPIVLRWCSGGSGRARLQVESTWGGRPMR